MSTQITVTLPDHVARRVSEWAAFTRQDVTDMVTTAIDIGLPELTSPQATPVDQLDDASIMALTEVKLDAESNERLDALLRKQREASLDEAERTELSGLMQQYHELWVRQAQALAEAVRRGLRPPLSA